MCTCSPSVCLVTNTCFVSEMTYTVSSGTLNSTIPTITNTCSCEPSLDSILEPSREYQTMPCFNSTTFPIQLDRKQEAALWGREKRGRRAEDLEGGSSAICCKAKSSSRYSLFGYWYFRGHCKLSRGLSSALMVRKNSPAGSCLLTAILYLQNFFRQYE